MPKTVSRGKPKKNRSLELLRAISDSLSEAIGMDDDTPAHALSGLASQYMGVDPESGEVVFPPWDNIKKQLRGDARRKKGLPKEGRAYPGLISDTLSLPNALGNGPEWSKDFQRQADQTHDLVRHSMALEAPYGFANVSADAAGTIFGQLPIPAKGGKAVGRTLKDFLLAVPEYLSPTTEARLGNYITGGLGVGALDQAARSPSFQGFMQGVLMPDELPRDPRIQFEDTGDYAKGGKVSTLQKLSESLLNGNNSTSTRFTRALASELGISVEQASLMGHGEADRILREANQATKHAGGGKVSGLSEMLRAITLNPDARAMRETKQHLIGDPVEEVLYAARQGLDTGKISEAEHTKILETLAAQENEGHLEETLEALHAKLFPGQAMPDLYPTVPVIGNARAPRGHGLIPSEQPPLELPLQSIPSAVVRRPFQESMGPDQFSDQDWNKLIERRMKVRKSKGGKISGLMGLREKLAEAARVADEMPTTAGLTKGKEIVSVNPTQAVGAANTLKDLPPLELPGGFELPPRPGLKMPTASRRDVLQGMVGVLSPIDIPINASGIAKTMANQMVKKPPGWGDVKAHEELLNIFQEFESDPDEIPWRHIFKTLKKYPEAATAIPKFRDFRKHLRNLSDEGDWEAQENVSVQLTKEMEEALEPVFKSYGFKPNPMRNKYGMVDPTSEEGPYDYHDYVPEDYEVKRRYLSDEDAKERIRKLDEEDEIDIYPEGPLSESEKSAFQKMFKKHSWGIRTPGVELETPLGQRVLYLANKNLTNNDVGLFYDYFDSPKDADPVIKEILDADPELREKIRIGLEE